jgi:hypothetical protein
MSIQQVRSNDATASSSVASVDMKLEVSSSPSRMSIAQRSSIQGSGGGSTPTAPQVTSGTRTRLHRKSSNAAGQADESSWAHRNWWTRPLAIALPPNSAAK